VKIVHALHAFPPYSRAGSENYVEVVARAQLHDHQVIVFHRVAMPDRPEYEVRSGRNGSVPVVTINRTFQDMTSFRDTYESKQIAQAFSTFLAKERPDVVHFHHATCLSTTCVQAARRIGIPVVFTLHDFWLLCPRGQLVRVDQSLCDTHTDHDCVRCMAPQLRLGTTHPRRQAIFRRIDRLIPVQFARALARTLAARGVSDPPDGVEQIRSRTKRVLEMSAMVNRFISPSHFLKDRFVEFGIRADRISVLDNGFDLRPWTGVSRGKRNNESGPLRVVFLGTWIPTKGVHILIEAFKGLDPSRALLDIHGYAPGYDGHEDYEDQLRRMAGSAPHIRLRDAYAPEHVPALLRPADVLVAPSIWYENSPLTIHEAFLAGVVVVASNHGGLKEFVRNGVNGLTFEPGNAQSLREVLNRLVDDRSLLADLRQRNPAVLSIEEHTRALERIYESVGGTETNRTGKF